MKTRLPRLRAWMRWRSLAGGFTLIELTVALAVASSVAGVLLFSTNAAQRRALADASRVLQADLRYAQRMAILEGRRYGVIFDVANNRYHLYSTGPLTVERTIAVANGARLMETSAAQLEYLPRGTAQTAFRATLTKGMYWQRLTATVSGGRIEIKDIQKTLDGTIPIS